MWTLTKENVEKIIANYRKVGRVVDEHLAWIIFREYYENKPENVDNLSTLCDFFAADLWNQGAVS